MSRIVVSGHSAGGQLIRRYAATSRIEAALSGSGIAVRYVVANPSSWLYVGPERTSGNSFTVPVTAASCPHYDDWHYGLQNRNTYANALPAASLIRQSGAMARHVP